jgi:phosphoribosylformylglycinamidine (FGAM) synthase PurS component
MASPLGLIDAGYRGDWYGFGQRLPSLLEAPLLARGLGKAVLDTPSKQLSIVTRDGSNSRNVSWFDEAAVIDDMSTSPVGRIVLDAAESNKFRLEFSRSYFQQGILGQPDQGVRGMAFYNKAKVYLSAHTSISDVAGTAIHEGVHMLGVRGSRRAEAMARFSEIIHKGGTVDRSVMKSVLKDIRTATDVKGNKVYMDMVWKLGKESDVFSGIKY